MGCCARAGLLPARVRSPAPARVSPREKGEREEGEEQTCIAPPAPPPSLTKTSPQESIFLYSMFRGISLEGDLFPLSWILLSSLRRSLRDFSFKAYVVSGISLWKIPFWRSPLLMFCVSCLKDPLPLCGGCRSPWYMIGKPPDKGRVSLDRGSVAKDVFVPPFPLLPRPCSGPAPA